MSKMDKKLAKAQALFEINEESKKEFTPQIVWIPNALGFLTLYVIAVYGVYVFFTAGKWWSLLWATFIGMYAGESITMGAHRLWSHKAYKATLPLKLILLVGQTIAGQNCLWVWVRDHRQHHKYSDTDADPHNSKRGFFFSHVGWLMYKKHPEVIEKGKTIDMSDLEADPFVMFQKKHYKPLYYIFALFIPALVPYFVWNENLKVCFIFCYVTRYIFGLNVTWMVNSYAHMYGTRPYTKDMPAVESPLVAYLAMGEGWHNYHHTFPWDYKASELGKFNFTTTLIDWAAKIGWAYDLRSVSDDMIRYRVLKRGDGTHPLHKELGELIDTGTEFELDPMDLYAEKLNLVHSKQG